MLNNSNSPDHKNSIANRREKGFTIVEVIIAMVVFLIVTGAVYGVLQIAQRSRTTVSQQVQLTKSVRLALNLLGRDTFNAGFGYPLKDSVNLTDNRMATLLGVPVDTNSTQDTIPPVIAGNNLTLNTFAVPNTTTDQVTFIFKDSTFNLVGNIGPPDDRVSLPLNISAISSGGGTNQVTILGGNAACNVKDVYVITGRNGSSTLGVATDNPDANTVVFANNAADVLNFNQNGDTTILTALTTPATMQRVSLVTYYVTAAGILTRRQFANNALTTRAQNWIDSPLVYGVTDFQIQYILADGTLTDNPSQGPDAIAGTADDDQTKLSTVRQIRFTINAQTVDLTAAGQPETITMTSTFATRNLGYNNPN